MKKRLVALGAVLGLLGACSWAQDMGAWRLSSTGTWVLNENAAYSAAKGSASKLLSLDEAVPHHKASLKIRPNIISEVTLSFTCVLPAPDASLELRVPSLDISLKDAFQGFAFARFLVDNKQEYSLRGEIAPRGRLVFAPLSKRQKDALDKLFADLKDGNELKVALLQGQYEPRLYVFPLDGLDEHLEAVKQDCATLASAGGYDGSDLVPDYLTYERNDSAPRGYRLQNNQRPVEAAIEIAAPEEPPAAVQPPAPIPFSGEGGRASIDADGNVIMAPDPAQSAGQSNAGNILPDGFGTNNGPMQIDESGMPIF